MTPQKVVPITRKQVHEVELERACADIVYEQTQAWKLNSETWFLCHMGRYVFIRVCACMCGISVCTVKYMWESRATSSIFFSCSSFHLRNSLKLIN